MPLLPPRATATLLLCPYCVIDEFKKKGFIFTIQFFFYEKKTLNCIENKKKKLLDSNDL